MFIDLNELESDTDLTYGLCIVGAGAAGISLAHRFRDNREPPQTLEAQVLFDADKLDAIGAIGVARAVAYAARAGKPAYVQPSAHFQQSGEVQEGETYSAYHEYLYKLRTLKDRMHTPTGRALAEERHAFMLDFFSRLAAESQGEC